MSKLARLLALAPALALPTTSTASEPPHGPAIAPSCCAPAASKTVTEPRGVPGDRRSPREMTLAEAVWTALENSEAVRVIEIRAAFGNGEFFCWGPPAYAHEKAKGLRIAPADADADPDRFRAEVMALVRTVEQQYWSLAQQHVQLWAAEKALEMGEEVLKREQADPNTRNPGNVKEAEQRVEQFKLDLATKTSDVMTTERQLRNLIGAEPRSSTLGPDPADDRRIVPTTPPTEAQLTPDWDEALAALKVYQPDFARQQTLVGRAAIRCAAEALPCVLAGLAGSDLPAGATARYEDALESLDRERAFLRQIEHQTTHSLARFFLEVDANYKQFKAATRLRQAAVGRLNAQKAFYEEGRITIDRYLDAISQYANSLAQEGQFKASYNISIMALEESKGTLLTYDNITVVTPRRASRPAAPRPHDQAVRAASFEPASEPAGGADKPDPGPKPAPEAAKPADGRTVDFQIRVGGPSGIDVKGTFTVAPARNPTP